MSGELSLQERHAPQSRCFGCGPANPQGLHLASHEVGDEVVAEWLPSAPYQAFEGFVSGGILGTLLDCHANWTGALAIMRRRGMEHPPGCVTAEYAVRFLRPTPSGGPVTLRARVGSVTDDRAVVEATVEAEGAVTATCRGTFVAVRPGHPAYDRW